MAEEPQGSDRADALPAVHWQASAAWGAAVLGAYIVVALAPVGLAWALEPRWRGLGAREVGKGAALVGFALLALQVALGSRLRWADRPFGLDRVMRWHKGAGGVACLLLLAHPILLAVGMGNAFLFGFQTPWPVWLGKAALVLVVGVVFVALYFPQLGLDYQRWRGMHKGAVAVVALGFVHGLVTGSDLHSAGMRAYWWALGALAGGLFVYRNVVVPLWGRRRLRVTGVERTTHDTFTIALEAEGGGGLAHQPGQFLFLKLLRPGRPSEEHPFTVASSPTGEPPLRVTIKESGDYTNTIGETRAGDGARVEGPFGRFSYAYPEAESFVFIAGGVGITPLLSMLRALRDTADARPAVLIYGNDTERDIIFRDELEALPETVRVVHVLARPEASWDGPTGYVTEGILEREAGELLGEARVYLCGPPPMMDKVETALRGLGVPRSRIHTERFAL
ncbi:MAG: ferric reductase-like transmembrane domain-containing protein [Candidatus Brocadiia bacterium]